MRLSNYHRMMHARSLELAKHARANGEKHARLMAHARMARFYFAQLRTLAD
ncbi:hypothetical protein [Candidatus Burkholderia verschuerenii]|uniref:hypothetical protein n=1 Tax=Candidatus Burkholderia verschuerenii TaxID=242163 RepID=UPI000AE2AA4B|nr:hypothetical protein [Candidatus Burkholderia verschuerenii]